MRVLHITRLSNPSKTVPAETRQSQHTLQGMVDCSLIEWVRIVKNGEGAISEGHSGR